MATAAPIIAPAHVVISIIIPRRMLETPFLTYPDAEPVEVATMPTRLAAAADVASRP